MTATDNAAPRAWCDRCAHWAECPCGCSLGWCSRAGEFVRLDCADECGDFDGEPPEAEDDPRTDMLREEGTDDDR